MGRGVSADRCRARHSATFGDTRGRWAFSLYAQSALSGKPADGNRHRRSSQPLWIYFFGDGELDFCLSTDFSRGRSASRKPGRIVSGLPPSSATLLAIASTTRSFGRTRAPVGPGIRGKEFCLDLWTGRVADRGDVKSADRTDYLRARICGTLCCCPDGPNEIENKRLRGFIFASGEERDGGESRSRDRRSSRSVRGDEGFPVRSEQSFSKDRLHQRAYVNLLGQISICCAKPGGRDEDKSDMRPVVDRGRRGRA